MHRRLHGAAAVAGGHRQLRRGDLLIFWGLSFGLLGRWGSKSGRPRSNTEDSIIGTQTTMPAAPAADFEPSPMLATQPESYEDYVRGEIESAQSEQAWNKHFDYRGQPLPVTAANKEH